MAEQTDDRATGTPPPAPRGSSPTPPQRPWFNLSPRWIAFFLDQVKAGDVESITSQGTDLQGTFTKELRYEDSEPTTRFQTEIPAFANTDELSQLLQENDVTVNAEPLDTGAPWWQTLLFSFGPVILLVLLFVLLARRAGNVQSALCSHARSPERRMSPSSR